ncbi:hypothetical protein ACFL6W_00005 [Thermodesulfobacteriota bacterium]
MIKFRIIIILLILILSGCAGSSLQRARTQFYSGNLSRADHILEECKGVTKKDRLLCYMEKGIILFDMESYEESTEALLKASRLIKEQDHVSVKDQSSAVLINDRVMTYKGEYSERLWVHTFLMMNFLLQYKYESALVEAKQALETYDEYPGALADDHFTRALIALCYENMNLQDDARIEYEKLARSLGRESLAPEPVTRDKGELVLFIGQGSVPKKGTIETVIPPSIRISIPRYTDSPPPRPVTVRSDGIMDTSLKVATDMGRVARKSLNDRAAQYLTRQALRAGAKETIADKVGDENFFAEIVVRVILFLFEEADTRSWETLPGSLTLIRMTLAPGIHDLEISSGHSDTVYLKGIYIPEGKRLYRAIRF